MTIERSTALQMRQRHLEHKRQQENLLSNISAEMIPRGTEFPMLKIMQYIPPPVMFVDMGGGSGEKARQLQNIGYETILLDRNPQAIKKAKEKEIYRSHEVDVTQTDAVQKIIDSNLDHQCSFHVRACIQGVLMQALLCNVVTNDDGDLWQRAITTASKITSLGGFLFIAEILDFKEPHPVMDMFMQPGWNPVRDQFIAYQEAWQDRYARNRLAGLPDGVFAVAKPGPYKQELEQGDPIKLINSNYFERYARHFKRNALILVLMKNGYEVREITDQIWWSRDQMPLPGIAIVAQQTNISYRFT